MVNEIILNYLRSYKDKFDIKDLKSEILKKGYSEVDFNEALSFINQENAQIKDIGPVKKLPTFYSVKEKKTNKGFKFIIFLMLVILIDLVLILAFNFFGFDIFGFNFFNLFK